ncbi:MAG: antibiotic biosynthesis monooxygenase [Phycisphaerales bacterium]|nr:antibiotic biosynthesis monooxygenase [Phycisphaerales bacterium]
MDSGFAYIWEYRVHHDASDAFRALYGPEGEWVQLFQRSPGYLRTELKQDVRDPHRFVTIDYWRSKVHRDHCKASFAAEWSEIDQAGEALTISERLVGEFRHVKP